MASGYYRHPEARSANPAYAHGGGQASVPPISILKDFNPTYPQIHAYVLHYLNSNVGGTPSLSHTTQQAFRHLMSSCFRMQVARLETGDPAHPVKHVHVSGAAGRSFDIADVFCGLGFLIAQAELLHAGEPRRPPSKEYIRTKHLKILGHYTKWVQIVASQFDIPIPATLIVTFDYHGDRMLTLEMTSLASTQSAPESKEVAQAHRRIGVANANYLPGQYPNHGLRHYRGDAVDMGHCCEIVAFCK
ncbi:hypothetical protein HMN09_00290100 [Mycena chlorophos]|uniref:Uncharacterized protein n=1 Tax=Mycena chlorophos TaxID=658473 RepID=A0A8H6TPN5_MYCCL|nr:hypothetical protein HMN09_00290100 [Mycena chlorophos]